MQELGPEWRRARAEGDRVPLRQPADLLGLEQFAPVLLPVVVGVARRAGTVRRRLAVVRLRTAAGSSSAGHDDRAFAEAVADVLRRLLVVDAEKDLGGVAEEGLALVVGKAFLELPQRLITGVLQSQFNPNWATT